MSFQLICLEFENLQPVEIGKSALQICPNMVSCFEAMVANYGMSDKIGLLNFGQNDASSQFYKPYSTLDLGQPCDPKTGRQNHSERTRTLLTYIGCVIF